MYTLHIFLPTWKINRQVHDSVMDNSRFQFVSQTQTLPDTEAGSFCSSNHSGLSLLLFLFSPIAFREYKRENPTENPTITSKINVISSNDKVFHFFPLSHRRKFFFFMKIILFFSHNRHSFQILPSPSHRFHSAGPHFLVWNVKRLVPWKPGTRRPHPLLWIHGPFITKILRTFFSPFFACAHILSAIHCALSLRHASRVCPRLVVGILV